MGITPLDLAAWDAWSPQYLAERLKGVRYHWYVVGGWALDLWHGEQTRPHEDLEFAVLPEDASAVAAELSELAFFENRKTGFTHCTFEQTPASDVWQYWGGDIEQGVWRVDMMIERGTPQTWCYKRNASLRQARREAVRKTPQGIAYLAPANALLFKAKHCRGKDDTDFLRALPHLTARDVELLRGWLQTCHPDHKWLKILG